MTIFPEIKKGNLRITNRGGGVNMVVGLQPHIRKNWEPPTTLPEPLMPQKVRQVSSENLTPPPTTLTK